MYNNIKDKFLTTILTLVLSLAIVPAVSAADITIVGVGDIVCEFADPNASCRQLTKRVSAQATAANPAFVLPLGDLQYINGELDKFNTIFNADWGNLKSKMKPVPGNHEYNTSGAAGYFGYFGSLATGVNGKGYYSWNAGDWHMIALNSETAISEQVTWLNSDLAANPTACTLAYFHKPRFSSGGNHGSDNSVAPFWDALYNRGVDVVLSAHEHNYERFDLQNPSGVRDTARGIREFVVGTGGRSFYPFGTPLTTSQFRRTNTGGFLKMVLHPTSYDFSFIDDNGNVIDSGSGQCIGSANTTPAPTSTTVPTPPNSTNTPTPAVCGPTNTGQVTLSTNLPNGTYRAWSRIKTTASANSYFLKVNTSCSQITNTSGGTDWVWVSSPQNISITSPNQSVSLIGRDDGLKIDKVILTQDMNCEPTGLGTNCETVPPTPGPSTTPNPSANPTVIPSINPTDNPSPSSTAGPTPPGEEDDDDDDDDDDDGEPTPTPISGPAPGIPGGTYTLNPVADARVLDTSPDRNYGRATNLRVNSVPSGNYREVSNAYLRFDLGSINPASIVSAKLRLHTQTSPGGSSNTQTIRRVLNTTWSETSITYRNAPVMSETIASLGPTGHNQWYEVALPISIFTTPQISLGIRNCDRCGDGLTLDSRETSRSPQLILTTR